MQYEILGRTGLRVSRLGMGGLFVSAHGAGRQEGVRAVRRALDLGINYIDTAPAYGDSEEVVGAALGAAPPPCVLSTKIGGRPQPFDPRDKEALRQSVATSLRLLKRDAVDILMIHEPDRPRQYDWFADWENFQGPVCELLDELKAEGLIRFTGLGGTTAYTLPRLIDCGRFDVVLTAFNYSLLWREALISVIPAARRQNVGIIVGSPLQQGALARCYEEQVREGAPWLSPPRREQFEKLYALVAELGIPLPELALRFVLSNPDITTVLTGARCVEEVEKNVAAARRGPLGLEVLGRLKEIADMVPFRPFEEPFGLPFNRDYKGPGRA